MEEVMGMGKAEMVVRLGMAMGERVAREEGVLMEKEGMVTEARVAKGIHMVEGKGSRILRNSKSFHCY